MKINSISPQDNNFLKILSDIANAPKRLHYIGSIPDGRVPTVAIIGTRKPTNYGRQVTYEIAYDLAKRGVLIISGLALGVDGIAHRGCLDAGGQTIAVLANGVDTIYPASHRNLGNEIIDKGGAIISEYEPGVEPRDFRFLERNRIIAGLADAIIVTEAAIRSGTTPTVIHALEQGKEIFVVPGNITSPMSAGCNRFIKQGARLITCADDVIEIIAPNLIEKQSKLPLGNNETETRIIQLIQSGMRDGEQIQQSLDISVSEFSEALTMMEINGQIRALGGNQWTLK